MQEIFKDILGYEGLYLISNLGRVRSLNPIKRNRGGFIYGGVNNDGYRRVTLSKDNKAKSFALHRLIAVAFIPNPNNYPIINHKDYDATNNSIDNLEWCTHRHNSQHGFKNKQKTSKYTGVSFNKKENIWRVSLSVKCKLIYIGSFDSEEKASEVYQQATKLETIAECKVFALKFRKRNKRCPVISVVNMYIAKQNANGIICHGKVIR